MNTIKNKMLELIGISDKQPNINNQRLINLQDQNHQTITVSR